MTGATSPASKLAAFLASPDRAGPYRLRPKQGSLVADVAQAQGLRLFALDLGSVADKTTWLKVLGQALGFPEWYGANFDALYDCLTNGDWMPPHGCLLQLSGFAALGEEGTDTLIAILQAAADEWREQQRPLWAALDAPGLDLDPLPA
jgi:RNAse (barnase) inhibitor barstar